MPMGYVLISAESGHTESILAELEKMDAVEEAYMVYGTFDIVVKIRTDTMDKIKDTIIQVRLLGKVRSTQTMVVMGDT